MAFSSTVGKDLSGDRVMYVGRFSLRECLLQPSPILIRPRPVVAPTLRPHLLRNHPSTRERRAERQFHKRRSDEERSLVTPLGNGLQSSRLWGEKRQAVALRCCVSRN